MNARSAWILGLSMGLLTAPAASQGIVVDRGQFVITVDGRIAGNEDFVIRRAGFGRGDAVFANGVVLLDVGGREREVRPLLRVTPPDGIAESYQVTVTGPGAMELRLVRAGRRYIATISSEIGEEDREFQARSETRVLELGVAHHYYFLRDLRDGRTAHVLEPRGRRQVDLVAGPRVEEEIEVGRNVVQARRVEFASGSDRRIVWYDRQGRVLRVEIPAIGYTAERTDLVG